MQKTRGQKRWVYITIFQHHGFGKTMAFYGFFNTSEARRGHAQRPKTPACREEFFDWSLKHRWTEERRPVRTETVGPLTLT